jgi:hypothetical protein
MLNDAGLEEEIRPGVWSECANTVTFLSNITSLKGQDKCPYQLLFGSTPKLHSNLRSFGEMGVVTTKSDIQGKLTNCGTMCMFVGYSVNHSNNIYIECLTLILRELSILEISFGWKGTSKHGPS